MRHYNMKIFANFLNSHHKKVILFLLVVMSFSYIALNHIVYSFNNTFLESQLLNFYRDILQKNTMIIQHYIGSNESQDKQCVKKEIRHNLDILNDNSCKVKCILKNLIEKDKYTNKIELLSQLDKLDSFDQYISMGCYLVNSSYIDEEQMNELHVLMNSVKDDLVKKIEKSDELLIEKNEINKTLVNGASTLMAMLVWLIITFRIHRQVSVIFQDKKNGSILIVDDNKNEMRLLKKEIKKRGYYVETLNDGESAYNTLKNYRHHYDLVIMDCEMPIMDGLECTKRVRNVEQRDHIRPRIIIGITSHTAKYYIESCKKSGMNEVIAKPISISSLMNLIKKYTYNQNGTDETEKSD